MSKTEAPKHHHNSGFGNQENLQQDMSGTFPGASTSSAYQIYKGLNLFFTFSAFPDKSTALETINASLNQRGSVFSRDARARACSPLARIGIRENIHSSGNGMRCPPRPAGPPTPPTAASTLQPFGDNGYNISFKSLVVKFVYAGMPLLSKLAIDHGMNPYVFVVYRQGIATLVIAPFAYFTERKNAPPLSFSLLCKIFCIALCGITLSLNLFNVALKNTTATLASASANSIPAITFIMAVTLRMEKISVKQSFGVAKLVGSVVCVAGAFVLALYKGPPLKSCCHCPSNQGDLHRVSDPHEAVSRVDLVKGSLLMLAANTTWSMWLILQGFLLQAYQAKVHLTALQCFFSCIQSAIIAVILQKNPDSWKLGWDINLLSVLYCGVIVTGISYWLQIWCIEKKGPVFPAIFSPVSLLITIIFSAILWNEMLHWGSVGGGVLLLCGLYLVLWGKKKEVQLKTVQAKSELTRPSRIRPGRVRSFLSFARYPVAGREDPTHKAIAHESTLFFFLQKAPLNPFAGGGEMSAGSSLWQVGSEIPLATGPADDQTWRVVASKLAMVYQSVNKGAAKIAFSEIANVSKLEGANSGPDSKVANNRNVFSKLIDSWSNSAGFSGKCHYSQSLRWYKTLPPVEMLPRNEVLGGYIFVCNNDTMQDDLRRELFGLPPKYKDSVRAITPGLPLFLYNYSTHQLHGVFQAVSFGGCNIDPTAWEDKKCRGESRFPAQVRIRVKRRCRPLEEDAFRPILHHYDGPKFRLQLSVPEALALLDLFSEEWNGYRDPISPQTVVLKCL
ncbi:hypothetical protein H6P81_015646 [Aristolochia fimbriata]|uniref:DCD domain-containing protein n=1 Tax=Aristolochia fimbriata TaxID=158543 RepID=A0AAV7E7C7_ARIFI|nr:hypothetical protein H6P81_015646 [Aristolochia fimbriata]